MNRFDFPRRTIQARLSDEEWAAMKERLSEMGVSAGEYFEILFREDAASVGKDLHQRDLPQTELERVSRAGRQFQRVLDDNHLRIVRIEMETPSGGRTFIELDSPSDDAKEETTKRMESAVDQFFKKGA